jgi:hypothetical protein
MIDDADTEQLFRLIQSIPSPKAEAIQTLAGKSSRQNQALLYIS